MTNAWQFAIAPATLALPGMRGEWDALLSELPGALPFQSPAWLDAYVGQWGVLQDSVVLVTARQQGRLAAVLPLVLGQLRVGPLAMATASLVFNPHMPLTDITARPADACLWPALLNWLQRCSGVPCDRLELPGVVRDGTLGQWLTHTPPQRLLSIQTGETARIDTRGDFDSLLKSLSSKHRNNLARSTKRAQALGPLRYEEYERETLLTHGLPLLLDLEAAGWKGRAGSAIGTDDRLVAFYRAAVDNLGRAGRCRIGVLWCGDQPAAAGLVLLAGRVAFLHKLGYREEWSTLGLGHLLVREQLQRACADPALDAASLVLRPTWSDVWRPTSAPVDHHCIFSPRPLGRLAFRLTDYRRKRFAAGGAQEAPAPVREVQSFA